MTRYNSHSSRHTTLLLLAVVLIGGAFLALTAGSVVAQAGGQNGTVYVGDDDGFVHALDADTGATKWTFNTGGQIRSSPTVRNGTVYVGTDANALYALDASTGVEQWNYTNPGVRSGPTIIGGSVYVSVGDGSIRSLDASDGSLQWSRSIDQFSVSSPNVVDGIVYAGGHGTNNSLWALDADDGSLEWRYDAGGGVRSSPTVVEDTVYVGSSNAVVHALDATTGTLTWTTTLGNDVDASPTVANGMVYIGDTDGTMYGLDASDGSEEWSADTVGGIQGSPTAYGGEVYWASTDHTLYASDADTGVGQWSYTTGLDIRSSPTADGDTVYVGSNDGRIYAVDRSDGTERWNRTLTGQTVTNGPTVVVGGEDSSTGSRVLLRTLGHHSEPLLQLEPVDVQIESESFTGLRESIDETQPDETYGRYVFALNNTGGAGTVTATVSDDRGNSRTHEVDLDADGWEGVVDEFAYDASQCGTRPTITISVQDETETFTMGTRNGIDQDLQCPANYTNVAIDRATLTSTPTGGLEYSARIIVPELSNHDRLQTVTINDSLGNVQTRDVFLSNASADSGTISGTLNYGSAQYGNDINVTAQTIDDSATLSGRVWDPAVFPNDTFEFGIVEADAVANDEIEHLHTLQSPPENNDSVNVTVNVSDDAGHSTSFDEQMDGGSSVTNSGSFFYLPEDFGDRINFTFSVPTQTVGTYETLDVTNDTADDEPPENASEADDGELHLRVTNHLEHGESSSYRVIYDDPALPGETRNVTGSASVTSDDTNLVTINSSAFRVDATDDENDSGVTTVRAYYDGRWSNRTVVVAQTDVENIDILPIWPSIEATIGDNTFFWILIATLGAAAAAQISTSFGGVGVFVIMMSFGWTIGDVGNGIMLTTIICGIFLGLNLATNIDMQVRQ